MRKTCFLSGSSCDLQPAMFWCFDFISRFDYDSRPAPFRQHSWRPNPGGNEIPINCCCVLPKSDHMLVCDRSSTAYVVTMQGQVVCIRLRCIICARVHAWAMC